MAAEGGDGGGVEGNRRRRRRQGDGRLRIIHDDGGLGLETSANRAYSSALREQLFRSKKLLLFISLYPLFIFWLVKNPERRMSKFKNLDIRLKRLLKSNFSSKSLSR